ncbi:MAG: DUF2163 domain-containing protein [Vicinamibacterales bacterium]
MKTVSGGFATHLATRQTSLATCWRVTRTDGQIFGFTDHPEDLTVSSQIYVAATGYTRTAIQTSSALNVDNLDLEGAFDSAAITEADLRAGRWDYAEVEIFLVNWANLSHGTLKLRKGRFGEAKAGRIRYTTELRGLTQNLQQEVGRIYNAACDADLGDNRCKVNLATFTVTGTITSVTDNRRFFDTGRLEESQRFTHGKITFTSGLNADLGMEVKEYLITGGSFELHLPMPFTVQVGDAYSVYAGCDKTLAHCSIKFSNLINFQGFPYVPGTDKMVSGGL